MADNKASRGDNSPGGEETVKVLEPGQMIRPLMSQETAVKLVEKLYAMKVKSIKELVSYDDKNYMVKVYDEHSNPHVSEIWPHGFVFKVLNSLDSPKKHVDAEHCLEKELLKKGFQCSQPVRNIYNNEKHLERIYHEKEQDAGDGTDADKDAGYGDHIVRMLTFQPGTVLASVPYRPNLLYSVGKFLGGMHSSVLAEFTHEALTVHKTVWGLDSVAKLDMFAYVITDEKDKKAVDEVIRAFNTEIVPQFKNFQRGTIHGDFNEQNIVVNEIIGQEDVKEEEKDYEVASVIDFGDNQESYLVFDIALTMAYMMIESHVVDPVEAAGHVLAGYLSEYTLNEHEFDALRVLVAGRLTQSLVMGAYSYSLEPWNDYLIITAKCGWARLHQLWGKPKEEVATVWKSVIESYKN